MWKHSVVGGLLVVAGVAVGGGDAHAAVSAAIDANGRVTVAVTAGEVINVSCAGGVLSTGPTATTISCTAVKSLLVVGSSAPDNISTKAMTLADFPNITVPDLGYWSAPVTLMGKGGDDVLRGGALDEYIEGNDGNDTLRGAGGNDKLRGGAGTDNMKGGGGSDLVSGQGDDLITGDAEPDVDDGYPDFVTGGSGRTTFHLTNADKYATCQDLEPDLLIITMTKKAQPGQGNDALIDDGCGGGGPVEVDMRITYAGVFAVHPLPDRGFLAFEQITFGGWRRTMNANITKFKMTTSTGTDTFRFEQNNRFPLTIEMGAGTDKLVVELLGATYTDSGSVVTSPAAKPINYAGVEQKTFLAPVV